MSLTSASSEQLVSGVVGRTGSYVTLQAVEVTVIQGPQQVSGCSQHHSPLSQVPTLCQPRKERQLDMVQRLKQVEHLGHEKYQNDKCCAEHSFRGVYVVFMKKDDPSLHHRPISILCFSYIIVFEK